MLIYNVDNVSSVQRHKNLREMQKMACCPIKLFGSLDTFLYSLSAWILFAKIKLDTVVNS